MDLSLNGKRALVCGSTQGIGRACALELAALGAGVTLVARNEAALKDVIATLNQVSGQQHDYIVADFEYPELLKEKVLKFVAVNPVDVLVNNTGGPPPGQAIDAEPEAFVKAFSNHLICNQILVKACVEGMKNSGYGRIINIISTSVKVPMRGLGVSNTIRGAVANWSKTLSFELGKYGITVNNVLPGATMTARLESLIKRNADRDKITFEQAKQKMVEEIPLGRISSAEEVAAAVAFLASPAASYINGINLPVDGGRTGTL